MKFGRVIATALSLALLASTPAFSAVKAGATCKKIGTTKVSKGKTYTCIKSGKKMVWNKGVAIKSATPTPTPVSSISPTPTPVSSISPTPTPTPFQDNYRSFESNLETCRLKETKNITGAGAKGFPIRSKVPHLGEVKIAIIPVDFSNAPGIGNPGKMFDDDIRTLKEWSNFFSRAKMTYKAELVSKEWIRAPKGAEWYVCDFCQKGATTSQQPMEVALQELIDLADRNYDFTGTDFVYFAFPLKAESQFGTSLYFHRVNIRTNEGEQTVSVYGEMGGSSPGYSADRSEIWQHIAHEILHFQGFIGHGPYAGQGIMSDEFGPSQAVTSWEAFLADWFSEEEIICIEQKNILQPIYVSLSTLDSMGDSHLSLMLKINEEELLIVERRGDGKYSDFSRADNWQGIFKNLKNFTAYVVNVNEVYERFDWRDLDSLKPNFWKYIRENKQIKLTTGINYKKITLKIIREDQLEITVAD